MVTNSILNLEIDDYVEFNEECIILIAAVLINNEGKISIVVVTVFGDFRLLNLSSAQVLYRSKKRFIDNLILNQN